MRNTSFLLFVFLLAGCSSLPGNVQSIVNKIPPSLRWNSLTRDVEKLLAKNDLEGARRALDEAGAGINATPDALRDRDRSTARDQFQVTAEKHFVEQYEDLWKRGKPRTALKAALTGLTICPWCTQLQALSDRSTASIAQIDSLGSGLANALSEERGSGGKSLSDLRSALASASRLEKLLGDSPDVSLALSSARQKLSEASVASIRNDAISLEDLRGDVLLLGATESQADDILYLLKQTPKTINSPESRQALLAALRKRSIYARDEAQRIRLAAEARTTAMVMSSLVPILQKTPPDPSYIDFAEEFIELPISGTEGLRRAIAKSHLSRAGLLAGSGKVAVLAIGHAKRAATLDSDSMTTEQIFATAEASFSASGPEIVSLRIETNPSDDPSVQEVCRRAIAFALVEHARPHVRIQFANRYDKTSDIDVHIESATLLVPSEATLARRTSSYLSHFENVPNPFKASLKTQLEIQKINVSTALNNYNYALSTFNIAPTEWALQNANLAQTTYNIAVDNYNELVSRYNATPSTISRPVYLPYSFKEGTVSHGWKLNGFVRVGNSRKQFSIDEVDTDFVRFGTRPEDRDVNLRRDDPLDIPVGTDRLVQQLAAAAERVYHAVAMTSQNLQVVTRNDLSTAEKEFLTQSLFPFGTDANAQSSHRWVQDAVAKTTIPSIADRPAPPLQMTKPPGNALRDSSAMEIASRYGPMVGLITSSDGSIGSGALISDDGLLLTAAHVVSSERLSVKFTHSADATSYAADIVFLDATHDVALLKLSHYHAERWFELALDEPAAQGEPVAAIGHPYIGNASETDSTVSVGIVARSSQASDKPTSAELIADIAVASGSSGGPLISRRTGKLVGVVTAVISPSITKDFATSGYWAVAAPAKELSRWLGLGYAR